MRLHSTRIFLLLCFVFLPYFSRIPGGAAWVKQYLDTGISGFALIQAFNAICWAPLLLASFLLKRTLWLWISALPAMGFLIFTHGTLDLTADAQSAIALVFIPVYALPFSLAGFLVAITLQFFRLKK